MGDYIADLRRKMREEHRKKKEEERRKQEEQKRAEEAMRPSVNDAVANTGNDGYTRVYGEYGWEWIKVDNKTNNVSAAGPQQNGGASKPPPAARRSLDSEFRSAEGPKASTATNLKSAHPPGAVSYAEQSVAASPLSDVTCSQSPSKVAASKQQPAKRAVAFTKPEPIDENEEDPIMALMKQIETKNKKKSESKVQVADSPSAESNASKGAANANMEADPLEIQRRRSLEKSQDPLEIARMKEEEERKRAKAKSDSENDESLKVAKNPFALAMERDYSGRRSFSPETGDNEFRRQAPAKDLWDDSDEEEPVAKPKKKAAGRPKTTDGEKKKGPAKKKGSRKENARRVSNEDEEDGDGDIDESALKPYFEQPKLGPPSALEPLELPKRRDQEVAHEIPASINRYLRGYQQQGVSFLYSCIMRGSGAILGDDMGLGKTVQIISLLASLLQKTGTGKDEAELRRRRKIISKALREVKLANDEALMSGGVPVQSIDDLEIEGLTKPDWAPVLVIVPPSVIKNWTNEFETWGHFEVGTYQGTRRAHALQKVKQGVSEVLVIGKNLALSDVLQLQQVPWKLIIVDEVHAYKNEKSKSYQKLVQLREASNCPIIGLTGTIMSNNHEELYNLIDLHAPGHLGDKQDFKTRFSAPIKYARVKHADQETIQKSISSNHELDRLLNQVYITRSKESELGDELPDKDETVLFCKLTDMQKALYEHILQLPDYKLLRFANSPCDCGRNQAIFMGYQQCRTKKERINYQRLHRDDIIRRKDCCYEIPQNHNRDPHDEDEPFIHPGAVLWRYQHENDEPCENCPFCILFPALNKLYLLSNHAALLLSAVDPNSCVMGSQTRKDASKAAAFAEVAIPQDILPQLPGRSSNPYVREDGIMNDHAMMSGKMKTLDQLLRRFDQVGTNRILLFSHFTKTLDLIQQFVSACGYSFLRLDGSTSTPDRQKLVDQFQKDSSIFLFLISTKAGGLGLNLTAANKVICFDLDFNPSHDEQAQDRAYRIGQKEDVQVIRLISRGTIEEQKYIRQIYKGHLKNDTLRDAQESGQVRLFRGVQGDNDRKGEIFGVENLLKFKDGSFMSDLWKTSEKEPAKGKDGTHREQDLANALSNLSGEQVENQDFHDFEHVAAKANQERNEDFPAAARDNNIRRRDGEEQPAVVEEDEEDVDIAEAFGDGGALKHQELFARRQLDESEDEDMEEVLGGASQNFLTVLEGGRAADDDGNDDDVGEGTGVDMRAEPEVVPAVLVPRADATRRSAPVAPFGASLPRIEETLEENIAEEADEENVLPQKRKADPDFTKTLDKLVAGKYHDPNDDDDSSDEDQDFVAPPKKVPKKAPPSKAPPSKAKGAKKTEPSKPTFSAKDLFQVSYKKKKKKKKTSK